MGLSGRHAADRRAVLPRRRATRANRGRACWRGRGRRGGDALPAARGGARVQLRVPTVRARRLAPATSATTRGRTASAIAADPLSRDYVRHILGWYAQKHPDEDFAETFAVWLTPGSTGGPSTRDGGRCASSSGWTRVMREIGAESPDVPRADGGRSAGRGDALHGRASTIATSEEPFPIGDGRQFDGDLRRIFARPADAPAGRAGRANSSRRHDARVVTRIAYWTGEATGVGARAASTCSRARAATLASARARARGSDADRAHGVRHGGDDELPIHARAATHVARTARRAR